MEERNERNDENVVVRMEERERDQKEKHIVKVK